MTLNRALIPVYMNNDMLNNLFSVVVQEYIETKSFSNKDTITVHFKTPISEFSCDLFGKYVQGDVDVQIQNEFVKQKTEENVSTSIVILKKLKDILMSQKLLKSIGTIDLFDNLEENDYAEFNCIMKKNPVIENVEHAISMLEMDDCIGCSALNENSAAAKDKYKFNSRQMLNYLKTLIENFRNGHCLRYLGTSIENLDRHCILSLRHSCLLDNEDYLLNGNIRVFGKIVKKYPDRTADNADTTMYSPFLNGSILDYIDLSEVNNLAFPYLREKPTISNIELNNSSVYPLFDIVPIVIYI
ncbi:DUF6414 family protein [Clostridium oryzae]|uniref:Uncharacterized protein n=1 Tax=Clostridium oryzae TaxID=1450648 RepID=A0A1V4IRA6_9CLOT|nr:hypothetical protein [Clostridium oryzae]OPJ62443.1 hypothetical protein CLORY_18120 [Clostridium oryzae]